MPRANKRVPALMASDIDWEGPRLREIRRKRTMARRAYMELQAQDGLPYPMRYLALELRRMEQRVQWLDSAERQAQWTIDKLTHDKHELRKQNQELRRRIARAPPAKP